MDSVKCFNALASVVTLGVINFALFINGTFQPPTSRLNPTGHPKIETYGLNVIATNAHVTPTSTSIY